MSEQVQCRNPRCSAYKVTVRKTEAIMGTKQLTEKEWLGNNKQLAAFETVIGVILLAVGAWFALRDSFVGVSCGLIGVLIILGAFYTATRRASGKADLTTEVQVGTRYFYRCHLCGYEWNSVTGKNPNPQLLYDLT